MGKNSEIAWTHHTFNPFWGCTKISAGCAHCYAERLSGRFGLDVWGPGKPRKEFGQKHWLEPLALDRAAQREGERQRVFCGSMCDWCDPEAPQGAVARLFDLIKQTPNLDWLLLTKRPQRIRSLLPQDWGNGWPNVWMMTTVEHQETTWRITELLEAPSAVYGISIEPMLGSINLRRTERNGYFRDALSFLNPRARRIDWVIVGGESGPQARPMHPDWVRVVRDDCKAAGVACFVKQLGGYPDKRGQLEDLPADLQIREFPGH